MIAREAERFAERVLSAEAFFVAEDAWEDAGDRLRANVMRARAQLVRRLLAARIPVNFDTFQFAIDAVSHDAFGERARRFGRTSEIGGGSANSFDG